MRRLRRPSVAAIAVLALAGCGNDPGASPSASPATTAATGASSATADLAAAEYRARLTATLRRLAAAQSRFDRRAESTETMGEYALVLAPLHRERLRAIASLRSTSIPDGVPAAVPREMIRGLSSHAATEGRLLAALEANDEDAARAALDQLRDATERNITRISELVGELRAE